MAYLLTLISAIASVTGNIGAKYWADDKGVGWVIITMIAYTLSVIAYVWSLRLGSFTILNALFYSFVPIITILSGYFIFKEQPTGFQLVGMLFVLIGVVLITLETGLFTGR